MLIFIWIHFKGWHAFMHAFIHLLNFLDLSGQPVPRLQFVVLSPAHSQPTHLL